MSPHDQCNPTIISWCLALQLKDGHDRRTAIDVRTGVDGSRERREIGDHFQRSEKRIPCSRGKMGGECRRTMRHRQVPRSVILSHSSAPIIRNVKVCGTHENRDLPFSPRIQPIRKRLDATLHTHLHEHLAVGRPCRGRRVVTRCSPCGVEGWSIG